MPCFDRVTSKQLQPNTSGAAEPPSFGLAGGFVRPRKEPSTLSSKGSVQIREVRLASDKERREVGSVSPHPSPISSNELGKEGRPEVAIKLKC